MPRMSGKDTFQAMKSINSNVKVLLASGFSIDGEAQSVLELGAAGFIQKPFNMNELAKSITDCLDRKKTGETPVSR
jgi:DNA-binding NtrC family response regulator